MLWDEADRDAEGSGEPDSRTEESPEIRGQARKDGTEGTLGSSRNALSTGTALAWCQPLKAQGVRNPCRKERSGSKT